MSIFLGYHYPCLDGAYALSCAFLFFREIQKMGITSEDFIQYISQFKSFEEINQNIIQFSSQNKDQNKEERKVNSIFEDLSEYSPYLLDQVVYVPAILNSDGYSFPAKKYKPEFLQNSVLILMDYYAATPACVSKLCTQFKKVIILDHHLTFGSIISHFNETNVSEFCGTNQ